MRRLAYLALLLFVFCLGLAAGAWFAIGRRAADFAAGVEQRLTENVAAPPARVLEAKRGVTSDEEMLTAILSAVAEDEPLLRAHRLSDLLGHLDSTQLAAFFDRAVRVDDHERRGLVLGALLARWAAIDPAGAAAAVRPYCDRLRRLTQMELGSLDATVNEAWAQARPEPALAEAMAAPDTPWGRWTARAAMQRLAGGDPSAQLDVLAHQPANRLRDELCADAIIALAEKDSAAAEARLDLLTEPRARARAQAEILGKLTERDPSTGLARLAELAPDLKPGRDGIRLVTSVLCAAAKQDAAAALAAIEGLPPELHTQALGAVLVGWARENPVDALAWAAANSVNIAEAKAFVSVGDYGGFGSDLVSTAFASDRQKTLEWLRAQPASRERDDMLQEAIRRGSHEEKLAIYAELTPEGRAGAAWTVVESLVENEPERAELWVKSLLAGPERTSAVQGLAYHQADDAPERMETIVDAWPSGPDRDAALAGIAWQFFNEQRQALDFARRIGDAATRETAFVRIARSWLNQNEGAARTWLAGTPELSAETKRVILRQFDDQ